jgi:predicted permease
MSLFRKLGFRQRKDQLHEEIEIHLRMAIRDRVEQGVPEHEARRAVMLEFGNIPLVEDVTREMWGWMWLEQLDQDLRYAFRQMRRAPGFAATAVGTLALGIGAAAAMFNVVDQMLLRPVDFKDAERLALVHEGDRTGKGTSDVPWLDIEEWMRRSHSFEQIGFAGQMPGKTFLEGSTATLQVSGTTVSPNLFSVLGVRPAIGPGFVQEEPSFAGGKNTGAIVLSHAVWQSAFNGDRNVLGKVVRINRDSYTVMGIMPSNFRYPMHAFDDQVAQVWTVVRLGPDDEKRTYQGMNFEVVGRLRRGVTLASAESEMATIQRSIAAEYTDSELRNEHTAVSLQRYTDTLLSPGVRKAILALLLASGALWLIATVNVTHLLLARSATRQREIAIRGALGASRWRVMQQMLVESLVLSGAASMIGVALALASIRVAQSARPKHLNLDFSAHPTGALLAMLCGLTFVSALLCAAWPTFVASRAPIEPALKQGGLQAGAGRRRNRVRNTLVVLEIAMSLTLLVSCGLLLRTIYVLRHVPLGYRTDHILVANLNIPSFRFEGENVTRALYQPLLERARILHGVEAAGLISEVPLGGTFRVQLTIRMDGGKEVSGLLKPVTPGIQQVFGFRMASGRFFNAEDTPTSAPVAVVNSAFARLYAPDPHAPMSIVGSKFWSFRQDAETHIVGILDDQRQMDITGNSQPEVEVCLCQLVPGDSIYNPSTVAMDLAMRTERPTSEMIPELRAILRQGSPELEGATIKAMDQIVEDSYASQRLAAHLLEIFGGSALLLCMTGLYGLLAYVVTQRTREMGVRIALGAQRGSLMWLVMRQASVMLLAGVAGGTGLALASGRLVRAFLYGVNIRDGWTLTGSAALLVVSGLIAAYLPARRASRVSPMEALRAE